ncbi:uncharacterized protein EDB93DRAFT_1199376 [Suillus bovinus]|uniref:uncharacterized protein n=1 Tax=Suillus bovinus TaxID=48563 RepID=UPI001B8624BE|nr:uncharacterized protein EDB93DRAFT_1199376 [Suillus bovinus]KAG2158479.1 hypothetical protein EDB93DRAFT_1199376 [Suillus bovinus]
MSGHIKDMNDSYTEALQALFTSLAPKGPDTSPSSKLAPSQLKHLANKIDEILGGASEGEGLQQNEKGELLNDEGLPIIDITEPAVDISDMNSPAGSFHEPDLIPESSLSASEREQRRRARDHILAKLEEEERLQSERDEEEEREKRIEDIRKRKEAAKAEMERLRAAKEMQKKMGKALLKNLAEAREKEERKLKDLIEKEPSKSDSPKPKKTVTFANPSSPDESSATGESKTTGSSIDWGRHPMKMHVVERHPASYQPSSEIQPECDSDDEPFSTTSSTPDEAGDMPYESYTSGSEDDDGSDDGLLEEEFDWDSAQHHREVALEYYKKRHVIGMEAARAMTSHTHDDEEWNQGDIAPDRRPKPSVSRFRADRMATAYDKSTSTSLASSVIPASRQKSLQEAIRLGKIENDHLVGGEEGESGSEDEAVREVLELLKNGHIHNAGPSSIGSTVNELSAGSARSATDTVASDLGGKISRFKAERM